MESLYLVEEYVALRPGDPFRLFPFGKLVKGGMEIEITPELARRFKLPHFKPPIKLGSHNEETPAGGHITALIVKDDGLYAIPEFTEKGIKAMADGDYRYHSPEVIWEGGGLEDPESGEIISGPLIIGDALLHTPHLGEKAALYQIEPINQKGEYQMSDELVQVPKTFLDKLTSIFIERNVEAKETDTKEADINEAQVVTIDEFQSLKSERDDFEAQLNEMKAEIERQEKLSAILEEFETEEYGMSYIELGKSDEAAEMLARMDDEVRAWVLSNFKALSKQVEESSLIKEHGSSAGGTDESDPLMLLNSVIKEKQAAESLSYIDALEVIKKEQPDLVAAAYSEKENK